MTGRASWPRRRWRTLAREERAGVRVNIVAPGLADTESGVCPVPLYPESGTCVLPITIASAALIRSTAASEMKSA